MDQFYLRGTLNFIRAKIILLQQNFNSINARIKFRKTYRNTNVNEVLQEIKIGGTEINYHFDLGKECQGGWSRGIYLLLCHRL
jgi:hypothetical protein